MTPRVPLAWLIERPSGDDTPALSVWAPVHPRAQVLGGRLEGEPRQRERSGPAAGARGGELVVEYGREAQGITAVAPARLRCALSRLGLHNTAGGR